MSEDAVRQAEGRMGLNDGGSPTATVATDGAEGEADGRHHREDEGVQCHSYLWCECVGRLAWYEG